MFLCLILLKSSPSTDTLPDETFSSLVNTLSSVDFPAPECPTKNINSPCLIPRFILSRDLFLSEYIFSALVNFIYLITPYILFLYQLYYIL